MACWKHYKKPQSPSEEFGQEENRSCQRTTNQMEESQSTGAAGEKVMEAEAAY